MGIQERKEREKERRRQQIMVAAKRVFSEKGFSNATMDDIAQEAKLSPETLYLYFMTLCISNHGLIKHGRRSCADKTTAFGPIVLTWEYPWNRKALTRHG